MFKLNGKKIITIKYMQKVFLLNWTNAFNKRNRTQVTEIIQAEEWLI